MIGLGLDLVDLRDRGVDHHRVPGTWAERGAHAGTRAHCMERTHTRTRTREPWDSASR